MTVRIWINRTYATNFHLIRMLRDNPAGLPLWVLGSHTDLDSPVLAECDSAFSEPVKLTGAEYVAFALAVCVDQGIDVFWPTRQQEAVAAARHRFEALGTQVMVSPAEAIALFEDKDATYRSALSLGVPVPEYRTVTTVEEFMAAYEDLDALGHEVCFKPTTGVGGAGFRVVTTARPTVRSLMVELTRRVHLGTVVDLLSSVPAFEPLMVMPYLTGAEFSVDTLSLDGEVGVAIPRRKVDHSRRVELVQAPELVEHVRSLVGAHHLSYLSNVQFRADREGTPYLLEVNTRPSGGLFQSCLAQVNMPWAALQTLRHGAMPPAEPTLPVTLTTLPMAVELKSRVAALA
ncbi:MAG: ATP-grasp domain protein [Cellulomonadaceae bacterium]|nr:ATP-grasp domain protein [Cellulomonadaceae bacterium]